MDLLLEKVKSILQKIEELDDEPHTDIHYDEQNNIVGFISSNSFEELDDAKSQKIIWNALRNSLEDKEKNQILGIFHETPHERLLRMKGDTQVTIKSIKKGLWFHKTPDNSKYWMAVDVCKFKDEYKAVFLIIMANTNTDEKFQKGLTFVYTNEIIGFMELEQEEIYNELLSKVSENAESEIKCQIMNKYNELTENGLWGNQNHYNYVFKTSFNLEQSLLKKTFFNEKEFELLENLIAKMDNFTIKKELQKRIRLSKLISIKKLNNE